MKTPEGVDVPADDVALMYRDGLTITEIAEACGVNVTTVYRLLKGLGVDTRRWRHRGA